MDVLKELGDWIDELLGDKPAPPQSIERAKAAVRAYRDDPASGVAWTGISKDEWCARFEVLLTDPAGLNQGSTKLCMPAACLYVLFRRLPEAMAGFCVGLARDGAGSIGDLRIEMSEAIRAYDVAAYVRGSLRAIVPVDYALLLAIQEEMSLTTIDSPDDIAADPGVDVDDMAAVFEAIGWFDVTDADETVAEIDAAEAGSDVLVAADMDAFAIFDGILAGSGGHAVVMKPPTSQTDGLVTYRFWSFGMQVNEHTLPVEGGIYAGRMSRASLEARLRGVVRVKLKA